MTNTHTAIIAAHTADMTLTERAAFIDGYRDGLEQPHDFAAGVTYPDAALNEAYDYGASIGQQVARRALAKV